MSYPSRNLRVDRTLMMVYAIGERVLPVYGCEVLFDEKTAEKVRDEVSSRLGGACPCEMGTPCPLLPKDIGELFLPAPASRPRPAV